MKNIPILAENATAVLDAALSYKTAGYAVVFNIVGEEEYRLNVDKQLDEIIWRENIPLIKKTINPDRIILDISKGFVTISVQSPGKKPAFYLEIHRARGIKIPVE